MSERFFCESAISGDSAELLGGEAHHLMHVMRLQQGDQVVLFDGFGAEFDAQVGHCARSEVRLQVLARRDVDRERTASLVLGVALPKGDRQKVLVEKCTELGVTRLTPLLTERGVARPSRGALEKLRRGVIEASKQCGRNRLMEVAEPSTLADYLRQAPTAAQRWIAHPRGEAIAAEATGELWCAIGPEGGFTEQEVEHALGCGWRTVSLGRTTLRIETAAIAIAARAN